MSNVEAFTWPKVQHRIHRGLLWARTYRPELPERWFIAWARPETGKEKLREELIAQMRKKGLTV